MAKCCSQLKEQVAYTERTGLILHLEENERKEHLYQRKWRQNVGIFKRGRCEEENGTHIPQFAQYDLELYIFFPFNKKN